MRHPLDRVEVRQLPGARVWVSRRGNVYKSFRDLSTVDAAVLDGEIVHLEADGKPQFYDLLRRRSPQQFVASELLWLNGRDPNYSQAEGRS